jgi:hypothetical protein
MQAEFPARKNLQVYALAAGVHAPDWSIRRKRWGLVPSVGNNSPTGARRQRELKAGN